MGTLFIDANNKDNLEDFNTIIYGHHMKDPMHSMFGSLKNYFYKSGYYERHKQFEYITPNEKYHLNKMDVVNVRLVKEPSLYAETPVKSPSDVLRAVADELKLYDREVFAILNLKTNGQIINLNICGVGTLDSSLVSPREIFKSSILSNASAFIAIPNHPSGNLEPSEDDKKTTERLFSCGDLLGIKMLDHIIIGGENGQMLSMKSEGMMPTSNIKSLER